MLTSKKFTILLFILIFAVIIFIGYPHIINRFGKHKHMENISPNEIEKIIVYKKRNFGFEGVDIIICQSSLISEDLSIIQTLDNRDHWLEVDKCYQYIRWTDDEVIVGPGFNEEITLPRLYPRRVPKLIRAKNRHKIDREQTKGR